MNQQKINPHGLVVVVVVRDVVVVGRVVVVVGLVVVLAVVVTAVVVVVVPLPVVVVVVLDAAVVVVVVLDRVPPVAEAAVVVVRPGCELLVTTTMCASPTGWTAWGASVMAPWANRAASTAPTNAPIASRVEPPAAVSIGLEYRHPPGGSNRSRVIGTGSILVISSRYRRFTPRVPRSA